MAGINRSDDTTLNIRVFSIYSHSFLFSSRRYLSYIIKMIKFADDFFFKAGSERIEGHAVSYHSSAIKRFRRTVITVGVFNLHDNAVVCPSACMFLHITRSDNRESIALWSILTLNRNIL